MRFTLVPFDKLLIVDGYGIDDMDFTGIDPDIHAVQFLDGEGHIEYKNRPPVKITNLYNFDHFLNQYRDKKDFREKKKLDPYHGMPLEDRVTAMKEDSKRELNDFFFYKGLEPVVTPHGTFNGGEGSATSILGAINLADVLGENQIVLTDINNEEVKLNKSQSLVVASEVAKAFRSGFLKKQAAKREVKKAPTPDDIKAIVANAKTSGGN